MKSFVLRFLLFLVLLTFKASPILYGQSCNYTLKGTIQDLHDQSPIFGALITIEGTSFFSQTDELGNYSFENLCPGTYLLTIAHPQCTSLQRKIGIRQNQTLNFQLEHHINELEEIIVSDSNLEKLTNSVQEAQLTTDQILEFSSKSLADALNRVSGVSVLRTGNSIAKPIIHGMYGSRVGIVSNGVRLRDQEWGADHAPTVDLNAFETVQLVKGAAALKYGGDVPGGIIVLSPTKKPLKDSLYGNTVLNMETNGRGGSISSRLVRTYLSGFYYSGQFTAKKFGDFQAPKYNLSNTGLQEGNLSFKFGRSRIVKGWEFNYSRFHNEVGILRAAHIGNIQDLTAALSSDIPLRINPFTYAIDAPKQQGIHQNIQFSYFTTTQSQAKWRWEYSYQINQRKEFDVRRGNRSDLPAIDIKLQTHTLLGNYTWKKLENWKYEWGINGLFQDNFSNPNTGVKRLIPDHTKMELGSYFVGVYKPDNMFSWDWGLRLDGVFIDALKYYDESDWIERGYADAFDHFEMEDLGTQLLTNPKYNYLNVAAQTGVVFAFGKDFQTNFSYILSQRSPNASELFSDGLHHSLATIEYGNLRLEKETIHKLLLGLSKTSDSFQTSISPYISKAQNYIYIVPRGLEQTIRGAFPFWVYEATDALFMGIDLDADFDLSQELNFKWSASYTYAQDLEANVPLISIPPFNMNQKIRYTPKSKKWNLEIAHQSVSKQLRFPDNNFQFNTIQMGTIVPQTVDISTPPGSFNQLDMAFTLYFNKSSMLNSHIKLMLKNITNNDYRDYLNRLRYYAAENGRNIQLQLNFTY